VPCHGDVAAHRGDAELGAVGAGVEQGSEFCGVRVQALQPAFNGPARSGLGEPADAAQEAR
jgi:hypothetical protein